MDTKRGAETQYIQLLVKIFRYRNRSVFLTLGDPLPEKTPIPKPAPMNIIARAKEIKAYIEAKPQRTHLDAALRFKITRARISQMMKIIERLPDEFIVYMLNCQDRATLNRFSGKTLLKIASIPIMNNRKIYIKQAMSTLN